MSSIDLAEDTERRAALKVQSWQDYASERGEAAIIYLASYQDYQDGYYVVKAKRRETVEAAQFALDRWAGRCIAGEPVGIEVILHEYALAVEKGLVKR